MDAGYSRREVLALGIGLGAGLTVGFRASDARAAIGFNPFVRVDPDGWVTVIVKHLDMGQGSATGLATLVAEELDAHPDRVRAEFAPADARTYKNFSFGDQGTGASSAIANSFDQYRTAGAAARDMLVRAAAAQWGVGAADIRVNRGRLIGPDGQRARFGDLAEAAAQLTPPSRPPLKRPEDWVHIGKHFPRVEVAAKSRGGVGLYGMDFKAPDMLVAVVARSPRFGGKVAAVNDRAARQVSGVVGIIPLEDRVAVLARDTWSAMKGREALQIDWDDSRSDRRTTSALLQEYRSLSERPGLPAARHSDTGPGLARATRSVEAVFEFPYLAHAPMEPLTVAIRFDGASATIWTGSQLQTPDQQAAARELGLPVDAIRIETLWAGGSFGRRGSPDSHQIVEAARIARAWGRPQPIKIVWTREDDMTGGYYRPAYLHRVHAGIDRQGRILAWQHRIVGQSIIKGTAYEPFIVRNGVDRLSVEGAQDMTYAVDALGVELHTVGEGVPVLWWRSVGHTHTAYAVETMIDRLAAAAGRDPVDYRLELLQDDLRLAGVLRLAAAKAGWGRAAPSGVHRGVAVHRSFGTAVAQIAEIRMRNDGTVAIERVVCAVDCGIAVNPDNIAAQMESSIGYGLGAALRSEITMQDGLVQQQNFDTYEALRIDDMPKIEVHIVASTSRPTGVGEPGTPPIAPAVANAILAATGRTIDTLPFSHHGLA